MRLAYVLAAGDSLINLLVFATMLARWRTVEQGARWIGIGFGLLTVQSVAMFAQARILHQNTVVQQELWLPVTTGCFLCGLSHWQLSVRARRFLRWSVVGFVLAWAMGHLWLGQESLFSEIWTPVQSLLLLAAAAYTLVRRGTVVIDAPTSHGWFWICIGLMLNFGTEAPLDPLVARAFSLSDDLSAQVFLAHIAIAIVAGLLVAWGMTCKPPRPEFSGLASS